MKFYLTVIKIFFKNKIAELQTFVKNFDFDRPSPDMPYILHLLFCTIWIVVFISLMLSIFLFVILIFERSMTGLGMIIYGIEDFSLWKFISLNEFSSTTKGMHYDIQSDYWICHDYFGLGGMWLLIKLAWIGGISLVSYFMYSTAKYYYFIIKRNWIIAIDEARSKK